MGALHHVDFGLDDGETQVKQREDEQDLLEQDELAVGEIGLPGILYELELALLVLLVADGFVEDLDCAARWHHLVDEVALLADGRHIDHLLLLGLLVLGLPDADADRLEYQLLGGLRAPYCFHPNSIDNLIGYIESQKTKVCLYHQTQHPSGLADVGALTFRH